jgi:hypothetical protein
MRKRVHSLPDLAAALAATLSVLAPLPLETGWEGSGQGVWPRPLPGGTA